MVVDNASDGLPQDGFEDHNAAGKDAWIRATVNSIIARRISLENNDTLIERGLSDRLGRSPGHATPFLKSQVPSTAEDAPVETEAVRPSHARLPLLWNGIGVSKAPLIL